MRIGIPRERKQGECRVAITPARAKQLITKGHTILIETDAGAKSGFLNSDFASVGATICSTLEKIWTQAELLVKVKEPAEEELRFFRNDLIVFSFLHHAAFPQLTATMLKTGVTGLDYDLVTESDGSLPILRPMSVVAGKLSIQCGALALQSNLGGRGVLLGGTHTVAPAKVLVIGAGAAGSSAAEVALGMGAFVCMLDIDEKKLSSLPTHNHLQRKISSRETIAEEIRSADLVIGSVLIPGDQAPKLITAPMLKTMLPGSVIVDICIDQGGCAETSRTTSIAEPTYTVDGIVHYCVPNMPALVPKTSTEALTHETFPFIELLADFGLHTALNKAIPLRKALTTFKGNLTNSVIGRALGITFITESETDQLLKKSYM